MNRKPKPAAEAAELRRRAEAKLQAPDSEQVLRPLMTELSHRVATQLQEGRTTAAPARPEADTQRLIHELQVHQVELEMLNTELQEAGDRMEAMLEKYTDLYDFAPVGYFSLDEQGMILDVNLTGAALLGVERSRLLNQRFLRFLAPAKQPIFLAFLTKVFAQPGKQVCEATVLKEGDAEFLADFQATPAIALGDPRKSCRLAVSDITPLKRGKEAQLRVEALTAANRDLKLEIVRRKAAEKSLKKSEQHAGRLLEQAHHQRKQLRHLTYRILSALEEERKTISRELHDEIAQTLTGINIHLATLTSAATVNTTGLKKTIARTQKMVEKSVNIVHQFARDLRPTVLDDLGLIPALHSFLKDFTKRAKVRVHFTAFAKVEQLSSARRTVLYRVAQSALTNVAQHAEATQVDVSIQKVSNTVRLEIHDNGKSFDVEQVLFAKRYKRLGLLSMRERVEMVGGGFSVASAPGQGTTICARVPFAEGHEKRGGHRLIRPSRHLDRP
jgi:signal transduction histidine kinase